MRLTESNSRAFLKIFILLWLTFLLIFSSSLVNGAQAEWKEIVFETKSQFQKGAFGQTVLEGTEENPEIRLASYYDFVWSFADTDFSSGWEPQKKGFWAAADVVSGQIYIKATRDRSIDDSYGFFIKRALLHDKFVVEYRIQFAQIEPSGVFVPGDALQDQPKGACALLEIAKPGRGGLRVEIFTDRIVSVWPRNAALKDYPTTAYINAPTELGRWYTLRFEGDFQDNERKVQVYRDDTWIGELKRNPREGRDAFVQVMAYSQKIGGLAEIFISQVKAGEKITSLFSTGSYTSEVLDLGPTAFGGLSWTEDKFPSPWKEWTKYSGNPVLDDPDANGNLVESILADVHDPLQQPIVYPHPTLGDKYWLAYATCCGGEIRVAYSDDLFHWTRYERNPILSPGPGEYCLFCPHLFKDGATYYMVYDVSLPSSHGGAQRITYATAPTPLGPWEKWPIILDIGAPGEWDEGRVTEPFIWKEGETYYLYYMGDILPPYGRGEQVGLASTPASHFPQGPWTKHGVILPICEDPNAWDRGLTADPSVIKIGDIYYLYYTGSYVNAQWKLGIAWSYSPVGPWNRPSAPTLLPGPAAWEQDRIVRGAIHFHEGNFYMTYSGYDGHRFRGGMATAEPRAPETLIQFTTRTSADGINWEDWKPVLNGAVIQSIRNRYFQFQGTLHLSSWGSSPVLTGVTIGDTGPYLVSATASPGGTISPAGTVTVNYDSSQTFTITPDPGYHISDVKVDGVSQSPIHTYTFNHLVSNHTIAVIFAPGLQPVFAVNCGGLQYKDKNGLVYQADTYFTGGKTYQTLETVLETQDGPPYQSERWGNFFYSIPVSNGTYSVTLKFAEVFHNYAGARVFDVKIEGETAIRNLDIFAKAGKNKAYDVTIPVTVTDGMLNIEFITQVGSAKVSAILVSLGSFAPSFVITATAGSGGTVTPFGPTTVSYGSSQIFTVTPNQDYHISDVRVDSLSQGPVNKYTFDHVILNHAIEASFAPDPPERYPAFAVNCGGSQYTDKNGLVYQADTLFTDGQTYKTTAAIAATDDGTLYQSERFGNFIYNIPVPNGNYSVTLKFAEIYLNYGGGRVFDVKVEGKKVISNLDIFAKAGKNKVYDVTLPVTVTDGMLNIEFITKVGGAKVSAILVTKL